MAITLVDVVEDSEESSTIPVAPPSRVMDGDVFVGHYTSLDTGETLPAFGQAIDENACPDCGAKPGECCDLSAFGLVGSSRYGMHARRLRRGGEGG